MDLSLYLLTTERDPRVARVTSFADISRLPLPVLVQGERVNVTVYLLSAASTYDARSGDVSLAPTLSLGRRGEVALATTDDFTAITNGWTCTLDLTTAELAYALRQNPRGLALSFKTVASGPETTVFLTGDVTVLGAVDDPPPGTALTPTAYYTAAQINALLAGLLGARVSVPASSTDAGTQYTWAVDTDYFYLCIAANTWRRWPISDWA